MVDEIPTVHEAETMSNTEPKARPLINVTPLIDVLLVMLIIFMCVSPMKPARFKTTIPGPPEPDKIIEPWDMGLRVDLSSDEKLTLNGAPVGTLGNPDELVSTLTTVFEKRELAHSVDPRTGLIAKTVYINAPREVKYGRVARLIDNVKLSGAAPIGLQIDELKER
jgi:biopolymer transport protein TolR